MNEVRKKRTRVACYFLTGLCLLLAGCRDAIPAGRQKGLQDAQRDRESGILKLKEYPPLPYSLTDIRYIQLLKDRCGVEHEVLSGPGNDRQRRAEVEAYNGVMKAAIQQKFGADILTRLRDEASSR